MIVTDLKYGLENRLLKKLDLMISRCVQEHPKKDALLMNEGSEGEGKSNSSVAEAYYIKSKTGRPIHLFFKLDSLIKFAQSTEDKIIIWDEPAIDSLATDHYKEINKDLIRLLMSVRKRRHFMIFNFTKFYKFAEYIVVDRALGMVHMYSRRGIEPGRFVYIKQRKLEPLFTGYKFSKKRLYKKFKSFSGTFPDVMEKYFDKMDITVEDKPHATYKDYEVQKDLAIQSIGVKKISEDKMKLQELQSKIAIFGKNLKTIPKNQTALAKFFGINRETLRKWGLRALESSQTPLADIEYNNLGVNEREDDDENEQEEAVTP